MFSGDCSLRRWLQPAKDIACDPQPTASEHQVSS